MKYKKIEAVIFDLAGTIVDFGSRAPVIAIQKAFKKQGVEVTEEDVRKHMGTDKATHISKIASSKSPTLSDTDVQEIFYNSILQMRKLADVPEHGLLPWTTDMLLHLQENDIKVGITTGYPLVVMEKIVDLIESDEKLSGNFIFASVNCSEEGKRPSPAMCLKAMYDMDISNVRHCVKVDDSVSGIQAGLAAGMWTTGIINTGNCVGMSSKEFKEKKDTKELQDKQKTAIEIFTEINAHYSIFDISMLPDILTEIDRSLQVNETPDIYNGV